MSIRQLLFAGLGGVILLVMAIRPSFLNELIAIALALLGNDYLLVGMFGLFALVAGIIALATAREASLQQADMPDPEYPVRAPAPGADIDAMLGRWWLDVPIVGRGDRQSIRQDFRTTAIELLMRVDGIDHDTARRRIENGTWTDSPVASRFLSSGRPWQDVSLVMGLCMRQTVFGRRAHQTVETLASIQDASTSTERSGPPDLVETDRHTPADDRTRDDAEQQFIAQ